jgi:hypothetical protein
MWLPAPKRKSLHYNCDFDKIDATLRNKGTLAREALILDEDLPSTYLIKRVRASTTEELYDEILAAQ